MKRILFTSFTLFSVMVFSQTFSEIKKYSEFYNKPIYVFEKFIGKKPLSKEEKFGISNIMYDQGNYILSINESKEDDGLIADIFFYNKNTKDVEGLWYKLYQDINKDNSYTEIMATINDKNKGFESKTMTISEIVRFLRILGDTNNINYGVVYKKNELFYSLFVISGSLVFRVLDELK